MNRNKCLSAEICVLVFWFKFNFVHPNIENVILVNNIPSKTMNFYVVMSIDCQMQCKNNIKMHSSVPPTKKMTLFQCKQQRVVVVVVVEFVLKTG